MPASVCCNGCQCLQAKHDKEEARRAKLAQKEAQRLQAKQMKEKEKVRLSYDMCSCPPVLRWRSWSHFMPSDTPALSDRISTVFVFYLVHVALDCSYASDELDPHNLR